VPGLERDAKACVASAKSDSALVLRPAQSRKRGEPQHDDFDGDRNVGRIYLVHSEATSLEEAKEAFRAEYLKWQANR